MSSVDMPVRDAVSVPGPATPSSTSNGASKPFDIVSKYKKILALDPDITMPMAAIEALIALLGATPSTTAMETVETVQEHARILLEAFPNPMPLKAGTDLFLQMLQRSLRGQAATTSPQNSRSVSASKSTASTSAAPPMTPKMQTGVSAAHFKTPVGKSHLSDTTLMHTPGTPEPLEGTTVLSFDEIRARLLNSNRQFVEEAKAARDTVAERGSKLVKNGNTVLTTGGSRTVLRLLQRAAERPRAHFRVLYVMDGTAASEAAVVALEKCVADQGPDGGLEVERVPIEGTAHALHYEKVDIVLVGTEVLCGNGGLLSRKGTYQLALLAHALKKRFVVAAESHKVVRGFPAIDLERFGVTDPGVDYTDPDLITSIVTEDGMKQPAQIFNYILELFM